MKRTFILVTVVLVVAASLIAGERRERSEERGELSQYLQLTSDQKSAWESAKAEFGAVAQPLEQKHRALMEEVEASLKSKSPDACGIGSNVIAAQAARDQLRVAREALAQRQKSVLTPEQRTKFDAFLAARGEGEMKMRHQ